MKQNVYFVSGIDTDAGKSYAHVNGTNMAKGQLPKSSSKPGMWVTPKT